MYHYRHINSLIVQPVTLPQYKNKYRDIYVAIFASVITFLTYASVYAFRKPFTVGSFSNAPQIFGMNYKDALVITQVLGYMFSKFYGIKFIAELKRFGRGKLIIFLVSISWMALLLFAVVPVPFNIIFLFFNGFPLGIIWGIVFSFVEGRKATDFIGASLAVSFIFSSGFVKSVAKYLQVTFHVSDWWLGFDTGLVFVIPLLLFVFLLEKTPPPSDEDVENRIVRLPMNKDERKKFFNEFKYGLVLLIILYVFLTMFRDIRDNFAADIWRELGYGNEPSVFTSTEIPISIIVLAMIGSMILIRNNRSAFIITHIIIVAGFMLAGISSWMFINHHLSPFMWMTLVGLGLYMGYIPFNCILFERLIATFRSGGNVGFLIYISDSFGYLGSVAVIISKSVYSNKLPWATVYSNGVMYLSVVGVVGTLVALRYFNRKYKREHVVTLKNDEPEIVSLTM
jgi:MFS family permease